MKTGKWGDREERGEHGTGPDEARGPVSGGLAGVRAAAEHEPAGLARGPTWVGLRLTHEREARGLDDSSRARLWA